MMMQSRVIGLLILISDRTHISGRVVYVFRTWLIVIRHGLRACDPFGT